MHYLVCYDITNDRTRTKCAAILEDYGDRVQGSVFELAGISTDLAAECERRLRALADANFDHDDSIRIYPMDSADIRKATVIGLNDARPMDEPEVYIV